jgi:hypothetical protein
MAKKPRDYRDRLRMSLPPPRLHQNEPKMTHRGLAWGLTRLPACCRPDYALWNRTRRGLSGLAVALPASSSRRRTPLAAPYSGLAAGFLASDPVMRSRIVTRQAYRAKRSQKTAKTPNATRPKVEFT